MYCQTCGVELANALSYCNKCGANLGALKVQDQADTAATMIDTLLWVIVGTTITLLVMGLGALVLINEGEINERLGTACVILTFVTLVLLEGVLVWRFLHLSRGADKIRAVPQPKDLTTDELDPLTERALQAPLAPVSSVTEETTRSLEPSYGKGERR
jgi:cytochrome bd-type quinol oxidase subunit 2